MELAVQAHFAVLLHVHHSMRDNLSVVMKAVSKDGVALNYASERLLGDRRVAMAALRSRGDPQDAMHSCPGDTGDDKAVLLLGAAPAKSVLPAGEGVMKWRGKGKEWRLPEGRVSAPVMPTLHPAFLLRQPQAKRQVWGDLLALSARLDGSG